MRSFFIGLAVSFAVAPSAIGFQPQHDSKTTKNTQLAQTQPLTVEDLGPWQEFDSEKAKKMNKASMTKKRLYNPESIKVNGNIITVNLFDKTDREAVEEAPAVIEVRSGDQIGTITQRKYNCKQPAVRVGGGFDPQVVVHPGNKLRVVTSMPPLGVIEKPETEPLTMDTWKSAEVNYIFPWIKKPNLKEPTRARLKELCGIAGF